MVKQSLFRTLRCLERFIFTTRALGHWAKFERSEIFCPCVNVWNTSVSSCSLFVKHTISIHHHALEIWKLPVCDHGTTFLRNHETQKLTYGQKMNASSWKRTSRVYLPHVTDAQDKQHTHVSVFPNTSSLTRPVSLPRPSPVPIQQHLASVSMRKSRRNQRERARVKNLASAVDQLQSTLWRERVNTTDQRRPRLAVLQRSTAYISLLTSVVQGTVSEALSSEVSQFVAGTRSSGDTSRANRLRKILAKVWSGRKLHLARL